MAKRELIGDSEEVRAAIEDLREKVAAAKETPEDGEEAEYYPEEAEAGPESDIAVKSFEDRINATVPARTVGDLLNEREEELENEREQEREQLEEQRLQRMQRRRANMERLEHRVEAPVRKRIVAAEPEEEEQPKKRRRRGKQPDKYIISLDGVSKSYVKGVPALNDVNIHIRPGEFVFIVGDSGSGKSTLIRLLLRELKPTTGTIRVNGFQVERLRRGRIPKLRRSMGVVFQDFRLLKDRNVYENVAFAQRIIQVPSREMKRNVPEILAMVGLAGKYKARPNELSGGEQQRVCIARALINHPQIILADEPTGNLDEANENLVIDLFKRLHKEGRTIIVVTHAPEVAEYAQRTIVLEHGKFHKEIINDRAE